MDMKDCPFSITVAKVPEELAGREIEKARIRKSIRDMIKPAPAGDPLSIIFGPRGMGKTTMLLWAMREVERMREMREADVDIIYCPHMEDIPFVFDNIDDITADPGSYPSMDAKPGNRLRKTHLETGFSAKLGISEDLHIGYDRRTKAAANEPEAADRGGIAYHAQRMILRSRRKPVLMLIDEGHNIPPQTTGYLASFAYRVSCDRHSSFHILLSGTPGVNKSSNFAGATYAERFNRLAIGTLDVDAVGKAIAEPLLKRDITVSDEVLEEIADDSHGYPVFIQAWGMELWRKAKDHGVLLTMEDMDQPRKNVMLHRADFYARRYRNISANHHEMDAYYAAAAAVSDHGPITSTGLTLAVAASLPGAPVDAPPEAFALAGKLEDEDFVWRPHIEYQPGIPSFLPFARESIRSLKPGRTQAIDAELQHRAMRIAQAGEHDKTQAINDRDQGRTEKT